MMGPVTMLVRTSSLPCLLELANQKAMGARLGVVRCVLAFSEPLEVVPYINGPMAPLSAALLAEHPDCRHTAAWLARL